MGQIEINARNNGLPCDFLLYYVDGGGNRVPLDPETTYVSGGYIHLTSLPDYDYLHPYTFYAAHPLAPTTWKSQAVIIDAVSFPEITFNFFVTISNGNGDGSPNILPLILIVSGIAIAGIAAFSWLKKRKKS